MGNVIKSAARKIIEARGFVSESLADYLANVYGEHSGLEDGIEEFLRTVISDGRVGLTEIEGESIKDVLKAFFLAYDAKFRAPGRTYRFPVDDESRDFICEHLIAPMTAVAG